MRCRRRKATALLAAFVFLAVSSTAAAEVTVRSEEAGAPVSFFSLEGEPGARIADNRIVVVNSGGKEARARIAPVDAETAENLGYAYEVSGLGIEGAARWTRIGARIVRVPAEGEVPIPFTVRIPEGAEAGDYLSGISVEPIGRRTVTESGEGLSVASTHRYAIGVLVSVPGPRTAAAKLTGASVTREPAGVTFFVDAENTGNAVLEEVTGRIRITREGREVARAKLGPGTFVPRTSFSYPLLAPGEQPSTGTDYRVEAILDYGEGVARLNETVSFGDEAAQRQEEFGGPAADDGLPIPLILAVVGGLLALIAVVHRRRGGWAPLDPEHSMERLDEELRLARERGRPLSVIRISAPGPDRPGTWPILLEVLPRIRGQDAVGELAPSELVIIAPDTSEATATGFAIDLQKLVRQASSLQGRTIIIGAATSHGNEDAAGLVARITVAPDRL